MRNKKGFITVMVLGALGVVLILALTIVGLGCSELLQTNTRNDIISAYYVALAGSERLYASLKDISIRGGDVAWESQSIGPTNLQINGQTIGTFAAQANITNQTEEFMIVSTGTVHGRSTTVTVKYGFRALNTNGGPMGSVGSMNLRGQKIKFLFWYLTSYVDAQGPIQSASTIDPSGMPNDRYVRYTGDVTGNVTGIVPMSFWRYNRFDTRNNGMVAVDGNSDNDIVPTEVPEADQAKFVENDVTGDNVINDKDAFFYYYTTWLNDPANNSRGQDLGINVGGANYYAGDQVFGPYAVPSGSNIIFVNGDADIVLNAQKWWPSRSDLTIVATGDITVVQPVNGPDDRVTLVAQGNVYTGGVNLGEYADIDGNMNVFTGGNFVAVLGGSTNGSIFANGSINIDTVLPSNLFTRDLNQGTDDWADPLIGSPLGLPPGYPTISRQFSIKNEAGGDEGRKPNWEWI